MCMSLSIAVQGSGPVHSSRGRVVKSEIKKGHSQMIQENDGSFNRERGISMVATVSANKPLIRGQMASHKISSDENEDDYAADLLDNGRYHPNNGCFNLAFKAAKYVLSGTINEL